MNASQPTVSVRDRRFRFYWRMRGRIAPRLEFSQAIHERVLQDAVQTRRWLDVGCGHTLLPSWRAEAERLVRSVKQVVGVDYDHASLTQHRNISIAAMEKPAAAVPGMPPVACAGAGRA